VFEQMIRLCVGPPKKPCFKIGSRSTLLSYFCDRHLVFTLLVYCYKSRVSFTVQLQSIYVCSDYLCRDI